MNIKEETIVVLTYICDDYEKVVDELFEDITKEHTYSDEYYSYNDYFDEYSIVDSSDVQSMKTLETKLTKFLQPISGFNNVQCETESDYLTVYIHTTEPKLFVENNTINSICDIINEDEIEIKVKVEGTTNYSNHYKDEMNPRYTYDDSDDWSYSEVSENSALYLTDYHFYQIDIW